MSTIALVHGAFHGAWAWDLLRPELESLGHATVAMDLPIEDPAAGNAAYADTVVRALRGHGDDVVLVGHSLAGLTIPLVAAARPIRRLVFLAAFMPVPGRPFSDQFGEAEIFPAIPEGAGPVTDPDGLMRWPAPGAAAVFYPDCQPATAAWATARLRRQTRTPHTEPCPLERWPEVPSSVIACRDDLAIGLPWLRRAAVDRLGVVAHELPGGHSPFLARPAQLAGLLDAIVRGRASAAA